MLRKFISFFAAVFIVLNFHHVVAQQIVSIDTQTKEHIFVNKEIVCLEDPTGKLSIDEVKSGAYVNKFIDNKDFYPKNYNRSAAYWYRIRVKFTENLGRHAVIEFFDQITDHVEAYLPGENGNYIKSIAGADLNFKERSFHHKNFEFLINAEDEGEYYYYFRVESKDLVNVIIVFRTVERFVGYALSEYIMFGFFYGMIVIFSFHNLLMYLAVRRRQYLFYILYILSVGMYEMSTDGIAFQYLWPNSPLWNEYAYGVSLFFLSSFGLIFTKELLHVKVKAPMLNNIINVVLVLRLLFFLTCLFYNNDWFIYKFLEFIPLSLCFFTGIYIWWKKQYGPARFFVLGYFFLSLGFIIKIVHILGWSRFFIGNVVGYYSLSFGFLLEMVFLSFAIGDQVRILRRKKENARKQIIKQMQVNVELKDNINKELESKVEERTKEVQQQSKALLEQNITIEHQNEELLSKNALLEQQAEEIYRMNILLEKDNISLKTNIEKVRDARVNATEVDFDEFSLKYPDRDSCYKFLADMKWENGYACIKCGNISYCNGRMPFNRRCTKCSYEESVLHKTIFENNRIPINKAFYLVYLMYNYKGAISSHKLSEKLGIRQSTCWTYASKIKKVMDERKKDIKGIGKSGWSKLILEQ